MKHLSMYFHIFLSAYEHSFVIFLLYDLGILDLQYYCRCSIPAANLPPVSKMERSRAFVPLLLTSQKYPQAGGLAKF
jgi:hypothetical protein